MKAIHQILLAAFSFVAVSPVLGQTETPTTTTVVTTVQQPAPANKEDVRARKLELKRAERDVSESKRDEREARQNIREDKRAAERVVRNRKAAERNTLENERDRKEYNDKLQRPTLQPLEVRRDTIKG